MFVAMISRTSNGTGNLLPVCSVRKSIRFSSGTIQRFSMSRGGIRCRPKSSTMSTPPLAFSWNGAWYTLVWLSYWRSSWSSVSSPPVSTTGRCTRT